MIGQNEICDVAKETIYVLKYFNPNFVSKIPSKVLNELKELAQQSNIIVNIDISKKLKEQDILEGTKNLISLIYYDYVASEDEKKRIKQTWDQNENLNEIKIKDKLFKTLNNGGN